MYNPVSGSVLQHNGLCFLLTGKALFWAGLAVVIGAIGLFFWWRERKLRKKMQDRMSAQRSLAALELHALQSQMDPHFIFNSLNAIHSYILSARTEQASSYLTRFSRLMRITISSSGKEWISLEDEIEGLELYLQLEQLRFEGQFEYSLQLLPSLQSTEVLVPPFIVQPYLQNAIWHRLLQKTPERKGRLCIEIGRKENELYIRLEDNGVPRQSVFHNYQQRTTGTRVAAERLHWLNARYHTHATITSGHLYDQHHKKTGTYTIIHLPDVTTTNLPQEEGIFK
jgi:LytS/YehU family sensor histidine kinase